MEDQTDKFLQEEVLVSSKSQKNQSSHAFPRLGSGLTPVEATQALRTSCRTLRAVSRR